ncbi:hypothetical protein VdG1_01584 [Verticillium dahliae VDG1]|nr:hypothetical protein VdG1_01584 [Verticillium dahliae VDG1]
MFTLSLKRALTALVALSAVTDARPPCPPRDNQEWVTVWGAMPQLTEPHNLPPAPFNETGLVFRDTTIRQTVKVSLAASTIRLQISNVFGGSDLPITAVSVALPSDPSVAGTSGIQADTARKVTFSNATSFVVPPGALYVSDPITLEVEAESILAISIYLAAGQTTNAITSHPGSRTSSWLAYGNHVSDAELPSPVRTDHWFLISALEARLYKGASTFAIAALTLTAGRLEQAYAQMAYRIRRKGIAVWGATLTPMTGEGQTYGTPEREAARQRVNAWIRGSGVFDAVVDFDEIVRDPSAPEKLAAAYDEGDHLHLNPAGYQAMADGFDLALFTAASTGTSGWRR